MPKKNNTSKLSLKKKINKKRVNKSQKGGVAPSCVSKPDVSRFQNSCHTADIHNSNLQANRDLDSAFKKASGLSGGGRRHPSSCGCSSKTVDFDTYLQEVGKQLGAGTGNQSGGGVSTLVGQNIGGMPVYKGYSDCCPPSLVGNKLLFSGTPGRATCGSGLIGGGGKKRNSKKHKKQKRSKSVKNRNSKRNKRNSKRRQHGGHYSRSKPAPFPSSFETPESDFGDVNQKDFTQKQPFFDPKGI